MPRPRAAIPSSLHHKPSNRAYVRLPLPGGGRRFGAGLAVAEVLLAFLRHAEWHHPKPADGTIREVANYRYALRPVREPFGHEPAATFGPLALKAVRQRMVDAGLSRPAVNAGESGPPLL